MRSKWDKRFEKDRDIIDLINRRNKVELLDETFSRNMEPMEIHSGRAGGIIEHARGLTMALPSVKHDPRGLATWDNRDSDEIEKAAAAFIQKSLVQTDFWAGVARDVLISRGFLACHTLPSAWTFQSGYPVRKKRESASTYLDRVDQWKAGEAKFPYVVQHLPMLSVYPMIDEDDNVICALQVKTVMAGLLKELGSSAASNAISKGSLKWYDDMAVMTYFDKDNVTYFISEGTSPATSEYITDYLPTAQFEEFRSWSHGMGQCPVVMIPGVKTGENLYEDRFKSFLDDAKEALEVYDFLLSRLATMVKAYYLPSYLLQVAENSAQWTGKDRPTLDVNLGGVTSIFSDEGLVPLPYPDGLPDASLLFEAADDIIQRHTLEDVLFGRVQGSAPAFQVNLRINVARSKLTPIVQHMATGIVKILNLFYQGCVNLKETIDIDGHKLTPALAKQAVGRISVSIEPKNPVDRNSDIGTAQMALQIGLPWEWVLENILDIQNPATLQLINDVRSLEQSEEAQARLMQDALEELDLLVEEEEFTDINGVPLESLPQGMADAIRQMQGGGPPEEEAGGRTGLGRGPYPDGAAPQTQQPRGLLTEKAQPQPGAVGAPQLPMF